MYYVVALVLFGYFVLGILACRKRIPGQELPQNGKGIPGLFYSMSYLLLQALEHKAWNPFGGKKIQRKMEKLYPGGDIKQLVREHDVKKLGQMLFIIFAGTILGGLLKYQADQTVSLLDGKVIARGSYTQDEKTLLLEALIEDEPAQSYEIKVKGQIPKRNEADRLEEVFWQEVCQALLGQNLSLEEISYDLELVETLEGYPFTVEWHSDRPDIIDDYGWIGILEENAKEQVHLTAKVRYEDWEWIHEIEGTAISPPKTALERQQEELRTFLENTEKLSREEAYWELPTEWDGKTVKWEEKQEDNSLYLWITALAAAVAIFFFADKDLNARIAAKEQAMKDSYPLIVNKLILYFGAGMNVRGALMRMVDNYNKELDEGRAINPAYEELLHACREIKTGVPEDDVYGRLGKRSGLQEYIRFGALLSQNLKKGNQFFLERLKEEANNSRQEQINRFRKKGEEASTKLLIPMVMMLGIVMVMIMIPAFGSF